MTDPVTDKPKRYTVYRCVGCECLSHSERNDALTCSGACRVKAKRNGSLSRVRGIATFMRIPPSLLVQAQAVIALRPELHERLRDGTLTVEQAQAEVFPQYWGLVRKAMTP